MLHTMYLMLETRSRDLRDDVLGYNCEDTVQVDVYQPIGVSPQARGDFSYATVLHALASGWRLMSQPQPPKTCAENYTWWLTNDGDSVMPPHHRGIPGVGVFMEHLCNCGSFGGKPHAPKAGCV